MASLWPGWSPRQTSLPDREGGRITRQMGGKAGWRDDRGLRRHREAVQSDQDGARPVRR